MIIGITKGRLVSTQQYRFLILDGCEIHTHIDFIEYCVSHRIIAYCFPTHTTHLLQPLDVGLFSPLQKAYGREVPVDRLTRFGNVAINKGNFLPLLVKARTKTYTKERKYSRSLARQWFNSLESTNCFNQVASLSRSRKTSEIYITPARTTYTLQLSCHAPRVRQAKLLLQRKDGDLDRAELAGVIDSLERFAINTDKDLQLERDTLRN